jgi:hypothetical protein
MTTMLPESAPKYARELELRALRAEAELAALKDGLTNLRVYLASPKFVPTDGRRYGHVCVADVFLRLDEASSASFYAGSDVATE